MSQSRTDDPYMDEDEYLEKVPVRFMKLVKEPKANSMVRDHANDDWWY